MSDDASMSISRVGTSSIHGIKPNLSIQNLQSLNCPLQTEGPSFSEILSNYVEEMAIHPPSSDIQVLQVSQATKGVLECANVGMAEAQESFKVMMDIHAKLVESYRELNRS